MWKIKFDERAHKEFKSLDRTIGQEILDYLHKRIAPSTNPKLFGKPLAHDKRGLWRYRVRDYRIVCKILDDELLILLLKIGHRKDVYKFR